MKKKKTKEKKKKRKLNNRNKRIEHGFVKGRVTNTDDERTNVNCLEGSRGGKMAKVSWRKRDVRRATRALSRVWCTLLTFTEREREKENQRKTENKVKLMQSLLG